MASPWENTSYDIYVYIFYQSFHIELATTPSDLMPIGIKDAWLAKKNSKGADSVQKYCLYQQEEEYMDVFKRHMLTIASSTQLNKTHCKPAQPRAPTFIKRMKEDKEKAILSLISEDNSITPGKHLDLGNPSEM